MASSARPSIAGGFSARTATATVFGSLVIDARGVSGAVWAGVDAGRALSFIAYCCAMAGELGEVSATMSSNAAKVVAGRIRL
jgi:hypothetical protein